MDLHEPVLSSIVANMADMVRYKPDK